MCRMMYLLTEKPLSAAVLAWEEAPGVSLRVADPQWIPEKVQAIPHGAIYQVDSSQGCGCGFQWYEEFLPNEPDCQQWVAEMQGLRHLLGRVAQEQQEFQLCTGWDFLGEVVLREILLNDVDKQHFEGVWYEENGVWGEDWDWLRVTR